VSELKQCTQSWQLCYSCILKQTFWFRHSVKGKDRTATNLSLALKKSVYQNGRQALPNTSKYEWSYWIQLQDIHYRVSKVINLYFRDFDISGSPILIQWLILTNWDETLWSMQQQDSGDRDITNHVVSFQFIHTSNKNVKTTVLQWVIRKCWTPKHSGSQTLLLYSRCTYPLHHNVVLTRWNILSAVACTHPVVSCLSTRRITSNEPGTRMIVWSAVSCCWGGTLQYFFLWQISADCTWNISRQPGSPEPEVCSNLNAVRLEAEIQKEKETYDAVCIRLFSK
jgi:hypothetical protein